VVEISRLFGKKIVTQGAFVLGEIDGAEVDMANWQVHRLFISLIETAAKMLGSGNLSGQSHRLPQHSHD